MTDELTVYLDGELVPASEAKVSVYDHSFLYGDGAFEGIRVYDDMVFKLDQHLERLLRSLMILKIDVEMTKSDFRNAIVEVLEANPDSVTYLRPLVSRGPGPLGISNTDKTEPTVVIIPVVRTPKYEDDQYSEGLELKTLPIRRTPFEYVDSRIKSNNYLNNILGKLEVYESGVDGGIMLDKDGYVAELCAGNIFAVRGEAVLTPPPANVLNGITRQTVLDLADDAGYETGERPLTLYDFVTADEAFVTGTMTEIAWIESIDSRPIGDGERGTVTADLHERFGEITDTEGFRWR